jgi:hypothetical protein
MDKDKNTTLSHLYGIPALVLGLIGLVYLVQPNATWLQYVLLASGWVTALFFGVMLVRCFTQARFDGETIGTLKERINSLNNQIKSQAKSYEKDAVRDRESYDQRINALAHGQTLLSGMLTNAAIPARRRIPETKLTKTNQPEGKHDQN